MLEPGADDGEGFGRADRSERLQGVELELDADVLVRATEARRECIDVVRGEVLAQLHDEPEFQPDVVLRDQVIDQDVADRTTLVRTDQACE